MPIILHKLAHFLRPLNGILPLPPLGTAALLAGPDLRWAATCLSLLQVLRAQGRLFLITLNMAEVLGLKTEHSNVHTSIGI